MNNIAKIAAIGCTALASMYGSTKQDNYLPITQEQKVAAVENLDSLLEQGNDYVKKAEVSFQDGISDGMYTVKEMQQTLNHYNAAEKSFTFMNNLGKKQDIKYASNLSEQSKQLQGRLEKNLNGFDVRTPELQKDLYKQGLEVEVEGVCSTFENIILCASPFSLIFIGIGGAYYNGYLEKKKKLQKEEQYRKIAS